MNKKIHQILQIKENLRNSIDPHRAGIIEEIARKLKSQTEDAANVLFVCVHNSRRSHMAQIWFALALEDLGMPELSSYSAGTEVTSFNPNAVEAFRKLGFKIEPVGGTESNPVYTVSYADSPGFTTAWSKVFNDESIPKENTFAVMVCSEAEENCPYIAWAKDKFLLSFNDPKESDETAEQERVYRERCLEIGREVYYLASQIKTD